MKKPSPAQRMVLLQLAISPRGSFAFDWRPLRVCRRNKWIEQKHEKHQVLVHITPLGIEALGDFQ